MTTSPRRTLTEHRITSTDTPVMTIEVDPALGHLGTTEIIIKRIARAEIFLFGELEPDGQTLKRRLTVQFEEFLPDSDPRYAYEYDMPEKIVLAGEVYNTDVRCAPASFVKSFMDDPETDSAQVAKFLASRGYSLPYHAPEIIWKRIIRALGADRRAEILFVYTEAHPPDERLITSPDNYYVVHPDQMPMLADFNQRALSSFRIIEQ